MADGYDKGGLPFIHLLYVNQLLCTLEVQLGKHYYLLESFKSTVE